MLYPFSDPPFVCGQSSMLHGQEQHCQASFVYPGRSSAGHLPEDMLCCFVTFYRSWKGVDLGYLKRRLNEAALLPAEKCFWSLIDFLNSYLMVSSVVGFYSLRVFEGLTPRNDDTTMTTVKMGWKERVWGEVGARVPRLLLRCWSVWDPLCFFYFLFFPFSLPPSSHSELLLLTNVFLRAPSMALVDLSNICLWFAQTLAKCKPLSCTSEGEWGFWEGVEDACSIWPIVAPIHLVMSLGVVRLVN